MKITTVTHVIVFLTRGNTRSSNKMSAPFRLRSKRSCRSDVKIFTNLRNRHAYTISRESAVNRGCTERRIDGIYRAYYTLQSRSVVIKI